MFSFELVNQPSTFSVDLDRVRHIFLMIARVPHHADSEISATEENSDPILQEDLEMNTSNQNGILNIAFLPDAEIQVLNRDHRWIDSTTDVLSFHYYDDFSEISPDDIAWEIILSESRIIAQATEHGHSPEREFEILLIHSLLHILGYDHETDEEYEEMWKWESMLRGNLFDK